MDTYITILRGINVSGQKKVKMADLRDLYESLDFQDVTSYIQSGNVIFKSSIKNEKDITTLIFDKIRDVYGFEVSIQCKSLKEFKIPVKNNPFLERKAIDPLKLHVTFLAEKPKEALIESLEELSFLPDEFVLLGKEVYLYCPNGYGRTKLTNNFFERKLKVAATTRNWKSTNKIYELAKEL